MDPMGFDYQIKRAFDLILKFTGIDRAKTPKSKHKLHKNVDCSSKKKPLASGRMMLLSECNTNKDSFFS
jgi:hypothetical protein